MGNYEYINSHPVYFDGDTMSITIYSNRRYAELAPIASANPRYQFAYVLSYSPERGAMVNDVRNADIAFSADAVAFIKAETGGVKFATVYAQAKRDVAARFARLGKADTRHLDYGNREGGVRG